MASSTDISSESATHGKDDFLLLSCKSITLSELALGRVVLSNKRCERAAWAKAGTASGEGLLLLDTAGAEMPAFKVKLPAREACRYYLSGAGSFFQSFNVRLGDTLYFYGSSRQRGLIRVSIARAGAAAPAPPAGAPAPAPPTPRPAQNTTAPLTRPATQVPGEDEVSDEAAAHALMAMKAHLLGQEVGGSQVASCNASEEQADDQSRDPEDAYLAQLGSLFEAFAAKRARAAAAAAALEPPPAKRRRGAAAPAPAANPQLSPAQAQEVAWILFGTDTTRSRREIILDVIAAGKRAEAEAKAAAAAAAAVRYAGELGSMAVGADGVVVVRASRRIAKRHLSEDWSAGPLSAPPTPARRVRSFRGRPVRQIFASASGASVQL